MAETPGSRCSRRVVIPRLSPGHRATAVWLSNGPLGCLLVIELKERTMSTSIDYTKLAASLDYAALEKKLTQLAERQPSKKHKNAVDVLEPLRERLLALQQKGWSSGQLAEELKAAGIPVSPARLRECLNRWVNGGGKTVRRPARRRQVVASAAATSLTSTPMSATPKKPVIGPAQSPFTLR